MAGDHACPVCNAKFTRPQHVTRHMRSHTGDRPYKCTQCGDQFARSDLLSRHVNKCHSGLPPPVRGKRAQHQQQQPHIQPNTAVTNNLGLPHAATDVPCDQCFQLHYQCDLGAPCGKCLLRKAKCTYIAKINKLPGISPATGNFNANNNISNTHMRRPSLPSLIQQQQHDYLFGARGPASTNLPYGASIQQSNNYNNSYNTNASAFETGDTTGGVPAGVPSYYEDPRLQQQFGMANNRFGGHTSAPYNNSSDLSRAAPQEQQYIFGDNSPLLNTLPALALDNTGYASDGSPDLKALANYNQYRRNSLQLPLNRDTTTFGNHNIPSGDTQYHFSAPFGTQQQQQQPQQQSYQYVQPAGQDPYSFNTNPRNPSLLDPKQSGAVDVNRQFDGARVNERLIATNNLGGQPPLRGSPQRYHQPRGVINGYVFDDNSSVSDFGGSGGSGHPSPVPSTHSLSGTSAFSTRSRRTSSPGSSHLPGVPRFQPGTSATSSNGSNGGFVSSLQGAIPLPTPLQMPSFGTAEGVGGGGGPGSASGVGVGGAGAAGGTTATGGGGGGGATMFPPPYQSFDNMKLEEASFAAAAKNATGGGQMNNGLGGNNNGMGYNGMNVLSAGGKERAINELKDFWSAFISEPLTGGTPGAGGLAAHMLMRQRSTPSLKTPMPLSSERSSILGGGFNENGSPTPRGLYPNGGTSSALGLFGGGGVGGSSLNPNNQRRSSAAVEKATNAATEQPQQQQQQPQRIGGGSTDDEASLRSYQEACLKRDPPMLRLVARPKSRAPTGSTATSPQAQIGGGNRSSSSPHGTAVPPLPMSTSPPPQLESKDSNDSNSSKTSNTTLRGVQTLGSFATPYAPDSKQEREWLSQFQHNRGGVVNNDAAMMMGGGGVTAGLGSHSRSVSLADPITMSSAMSTGVTSRPAYKRLPSQTLGPEHSKKQAMNSSYTEGDWTNVDGSNEASDPYHDGRGPFRMMVATSTTQPGYGVNSASGISGGGAQGAWQRQRSMSSPTTMRTFDWQTTGAAAGGR